MRFNRRQREGGAWDGGPWGDSEPDTTEPYCSEEQQNKIEQAYAEFIESPCLNCFPGLRDKIRTVWEEITIDCTDPDCGDMDGASSGNDILICNTSDRRVGPVLLHELVHAAGGKELDSEAVEHACFYENGATLPAGEDWELFRMSTDCFQANDDIRVGTFVIWDSVSGEVWGKIDVQTKGNLCFQSSRWKRDYSNWP